MIPKIKFTEMTLEENINIIKWAYYEKNEALSIHDYTMQCFPELANLDNNTPKEEVYKKIYWLSISEIKTSSLFFIASISSSWFMFPIFNMFCAWIFSSKLSINILSLNTSLNELKYTNLYDGNKSIQWFFLISFSMFFNSFFTSSVNLLISKLLVIYCFNPSSVFSLRSYSKKIVYCSVKDDLLFFNTFFICSNIFSRKIDVSILTNSLFSFM